MEKVEKHWWGKREKQVFISLNLQHIEIYERTKVFGITIKSIEREVHVPPLAKVDKEGLQVIYEAYEELFDIAKSIRGGRR